MSHPLVVTLDRKSAPRTIFYGDRLMEVDLPPGTRCIYPKQPIAPLKDVEAAIRYALERDVVVVAAAGNVRQAGPDVTSPAKIPGVIAVTGTVRGGGFWSGSAQGPEAVIAARFGSPSVRQ